MFTLILMITFILSKCESHMLELKLPSVKVDSKVIVELTLETSPQIRFTPEIGKNSETTYATENVNDMRQNAERTETIVTASLNEKIEGEGSSDFLHKSSIEKLSSEIEKIGELDKLPDSLPPLERQRRAPKASKCIPCPQKGKFLHKSSCQKYYECEFNADCKKLVLKVHSCLKCLTFNAQKKVCDLPENVPECSYPHPKNEFCTRVGTFEVPDDCRKYYHCQKTTNGAISLTIRTCPLSQTFDMKEGKCMEGKECKPWLPKCGPGKFYLNDEFSCRRFYYCIGDDKSALLFCPPNHLFDGRICNDWGQSELNSENK